MPVIFGLLRMRTCQGGFALGERCMLQGHCTYCAEHCCCEGRHLAGAARLKLCWSCRHTCHIQCQMRLTWKGTLGSMCRVTMCVSAARTCRGILLENPCRGLFPPKLRRWSLWTESLICSKLRRATQLSLWWWTSSPRFVFVPVQGYDDAAATTMLFKDNCFRFNLHGWPGKVISDRGPDGACCI